MDSCAFYLTYADIASFHILCQDCLAQFTHIQNQLWILYSKQLTGEATTIAKSYLDGSIEFFILKRILYLHVQLVA